MKEQLESAAKLYAENSDGVTTSDQDSIEAGFRAGYREALRILVESTSEGHLMSLLAEADRILLEP